MSVKVQQLTKIYGQQKAVNNVSFEANEGEVLGFLGPNGAGKSTTMKIISCFIPQTEGTVTVCGYDVQTHPMEVRQQIGYLPENNPLYLDMYVREYLQFVARLHHLGKNTKTRIEEMIALTGLEREQKKKIGQLSKGYRQRVGLAQAMLHNPKVLILDEPTSGLDPNQLVEIRNVIKMLGKEKTVILSSHIMQEVQAICNRVVIINKGEIVANDKTENLQQQSKHQSIITIEFAESPSISLLEQIPHIQHIEAIGTNKWKLITQNDQDIRAEIFHFAVQNKLTLLEMQKISNSLEDVFRELTVS
ncbi:MAG: gliding motility-associated ABC transporter ATP-binding subunit GldA [Chitinophagales bacterium]